MFGYFQFGQPQFADAPHFGTVPPAPSSGGGGGPPAGRRKHRNLNDLTRQEQADRMEKILLPFLNNQ